MKRITSTLFFIIPFLLFANLKASATCLEFEVIYGDEAELACYQACDQGTCYLDTNNQENLFKDNACLNPCTGGSTPGPVCGNGMKEAGEQCDDGNTSNGDGCNASCQKEPPPKICVEMQIIYGPDAEYQCLSACDQSACFIDPEFPEALYKENACQTPCLGGTVPTQVCGNGMKEPGEQCDDGNSTNGDGCSSICLKETLGTCVPMLTVYGPAAPIQCLVSCSGQPACHIMTNGQTLYYDNACANPCGLVCGNTVVDPGEECDDGNTSNGDGCSSTCTNESTEICHTIDFDNLQKGTIVSNQYSNLKLAISANNNKSGHPDKAIIFDSANPSGGDDDLGTPNEDFGGPGIGSGGEQGEPGENNTALNKLLIIAEDIVDSNNDGFVDDPDDEAYGGSIYFDFDEPVKVSNVKLVDIDNKSNDVKGFNSSGAEIFNIRMSDLNHNSVQTINVNQSTFSTSKLELKFKESGAVDALTYCLDNTPAVCGDGTVDSGEECDDGNTTSGDGCSASCTSEISCHIIDFNNFATGLVLDDELSNIGLTVSALNDYSSSDPYNPNGVGNHPHKVTIFDSANATGGDSDLGTPNEDFGGPGIGNGGDQGSAGENNAALGKLLIIAENDYDANNDGLIDSPDDELSGGEIYFDFDSPAKIASVTGIDIENSSSYVKGLNASNSQVFKHYFNGYGDNSVQNLNVNQSSFATTRLIIHMKDLGAIDNINFCK